MSGMAIVLPCDTGIAIDGFQENMNQWNVEEDLESFSMGLVDGTEEDQEELIEKFVWLQRHKANTCALYPVDCMRKVYIGHCGEMV